MTAGPLSGVRILEVATHVFVPMSGAVLADWGAEVIKVEVPTGGDPYRGLVTAGLHKMHHGYDVHFQAVNRGKRSLAVDLKHPEGRALLSKLLGTCDVFVTNLRPDARRRLRLEPDDVRADNPALIYVRGSAFGPEGPEGERGGYDSGAFWARSGMQHLFTRPDDDWPASPRPAFGDVAGGLTIAGAIGTALYQRSVTGRPPTVDVSLLALGMWQVQMDVMTASLEANAGRRTMPDRYDMPNPLMLAYRTADGRFFNLQLLTPDRFWPELCQILGEPGMATDSRFCDIDARRANSRACVEWLESLFAAKTLAEWLDVFAAFGGEWVPTARPDELQRQAQVEANHYFARIALDGFDLPVVAPPVQFADHQVRPERAPELGEHTEALLVEAGLTWDEISHLKDTKAII